MNRALTRKSGQMQCTKADDPNKAATGLGADFAIICLTIAYLLVWSWLEQWGFGVIPLQGLLAILYIFRSLQLLARIVVPRRLMLGTILVALFMAIDLLVCGTGDYLVSNLIQIAYGFSALLYFCCLFAIKREPLLAFLENSRWYLNVFMVVNMIIMFLQLGGVLSRPCRWLIWPKRYTPINTVLRL